MHVAERVAGGAAFLYTLGETGGARTVTLTGNQSGVQPHLHAVNINSGNESAQHTHTEFTAHRSGSVLTGGGNRNDINPLSTTTGVNSNSHYHNVAGNTANATAAAAVDAHENMPPFLTVNYIIKT